MLSLPPETSGARAVYSRARKCWTAAAKRQVTVTRRLYEQEGLLQGRNVLVFRQP